MLVTCSKCSSRYQIADDKIKPTGTKVRCPRCQNTFRVFQQEAKAPTPQVPAAPPEIPRRREEPSQKIPVKQMPSTPKVTDNPLGDTRARPTFSPTPPPREIISSDAFAAPQSQAKAPSPFKKKPITSFDIDAFDKPSDPSEESQQPPSMDDTFGDEDHENEKSVKNDHVHEEEHEDESENEKEYAQEVEIPRPKKRGSKSSSNIASENPKPFGDATFFAIQKMSKPRIPKRPLIIALSATIIVILGYLVLTRTPSPSVPQVAQSEVPMPAPQKISFERPPQWYKDDPSVFQDFLAQTAARPMADQKKPEIRAMIAEALILNGLLNGIDDQISSGLGMASSLIAAFPSAVYGFYGLSTYAQWRDDTQTLSELIQKWPAERRSEPEFRLSQIIVDAKSKDVARALESAKAFLMEMPENRRAHIFILSILLEAPEELQKSFGERLTKDLQKTYQKLRASFSSSATLPPILRAIDKKYARQALAASSGEPRENPKSQAPLTEVNTTSKLNERSLHRLEERRKKLIQDEAAPIAPIQLPKREAALEPPVQQTPPPPAHKEAEAAPKNKVVQDPKKLPKASSELMAMNKKTKREKTEAEKIFEQATTLQKTNHLDDAVTLYQKTLRLNPDFAEVYKNLGLIYMERKDKERALRNFKIYLQLSPQSEDKQIVEGWISSLQ